MVVQGEPAAFMSYVRFDDQHDDGQLSQLRERLAAEVRMQTGYDFAIFQDRNDIAWGQNWQQRIDEALDVVTLLLVILTPSFFRSPYCRAEFQRFCEREQRLGRTDLILPIYYISTPEIDDPALRASDEIAMVLSNRQLADWRELRFEPFTSPQVRKAIAQLASRMRDTFWKAPVNPQWQVNARRDHVILPPADLGTRPIEAGESTARSEPPTHVVDAFHRGDFATLKEAIMVAAPGDRILVRPGLYDESILIDKPLEILGDGNLADIEIHSRNADVIRFQASIGRIANLTIRQRGGATWSWNGVDITQGRLELEGCDISSESHACIAIRNGAEPRLRQNYIHHGNYLGVFVYDNGRGTLEDNEISYNNIAGVGVSGTGDPTVRRNHIHHGKNYGVFVSGGGLGRFEDNDITHNNMAGVAIDSGGSPIVRANRIYDGNETGVSVYNAGRGWLEDNNIARNGMAGVEISDSSSPVVRENYIRAGGDVGILVHSGGGGILESNLVAMNRGIDIRVDATSHPEIKDNRCYQNPYIEELFDPDS